MFFMHDVSNLYKAAAPCPQSISVHFNFWFAIAVHREFPQKICTHKVNIRAYPSFFGALCILPQLSGLPIPVFGRACGVRIHRDATS